LTTISATAVMARHTSFRVKLWAESRLKYLRISVNFCNVHSRLSQVVADDVHPSLFIHFIFHFWYGPLSALTVCAGTPTARIGRARPAGAGGRLNYLISLVISLKTVHLALRTKRLDTPEIHITAFYNHYTRIKNHKTRYGTKVYNWFKRK